MFKLIYKLIIAIAFIFSFCLESGGELKGEGNHTFYFYSKSSQATIKTFSEQQAKQHVYFKNCLKGESVEFFSEDNAKIFIDSLNAKYVFCEFGEDFSCKYYYTDKIQNYVILNGNKINLHLSYSKDVYTVGSPIIFGSF